MSWTTYSLFCSHSPDILLKFTSPIQLTFTWQSFWALWFRQGLETVSRNSKLYYLSQVTITVVISQVVFSGNRSLPLLKATKSGSKLKFLFAIRVFFKKMGNVGSKIFQIIIWLIVFLIPCLYSCFCNSLFFVSYLVSIQSQTDEGKDVEK